MTLYVSSQEASSHCRTVGERRCTSWTGGQIRGRLEQAGHARPGSGRAVQLLDVLRCDHICDVPLHGAYTFITCFRTVSSSLLPHHLLFSSTARALPCSLIVVSIHTVIYGHADPHEGNIKRDVCERKYQLQVTFRLQQITRYRYYLITKEREDVCE